MTAAEWRAAGAALAPLQDVTVLLLMGESNVALAAAARGTASAVPASRRVAVFDLAGAFGADDPDGLIPAFRDGRSLNALARPLSDAATERFVVHKGPGTIDPELASHPRWERLVEGFRSTGALLIIVLPQDFASARPLIPLADRARRLVVVDGIASLVHLGGSNEPAAPEVLIPVFTLAPTPIISPAVSEESAETALTAETAPTVETAPTAETTLLEGSPPSEGDGSPLPRTTVGDQQGMKRVRITPENPSHTVHLTPQSGRVVRRNRRRAAIVFVAMLAIAAVSTGAWYRSRGRVRIPARVTQQAESLAAMDSASRTGPADTLAIPAIVNPSDSLNAAQWSVEMVATNDRTDANLRLAEESTVPAGTLSPVLLGDDTAPWYKIIAGAFVDRTAAELLRRALRQVGTLDANAGIVSRVPFALRLDTDLAPSIAKARATAYATRGVPAYPLMVDDERATIYVGAFASAEQSVLLLAELRKAGLNPQLAYRVGRTY